MTDGGQPSKTISLLIVLAHDGVGDGDSDDDGDRDLRSRPLSQRYFLKLQIPKSQFTITFRPMQLQDSLMQEHMIHTGIMCIMLQFFIAPIHQIYLIQ